MDVATKKVEKLSYKPWGMRRYATDWTKDVVKDCSKRFSRGYCMHEHVPELNILDMGGRMFDLRTCQFLTPDPYMQAPESWLNHNRYAYCLHNPVMYTDPDGEWIHIAIGALIGGTINLIANSDNCQGFWQGFTSFAAGASVAATFGASFGVALGVSFHGMWTGALFGAGSGLAGSAVWARKNGVSMWTGKEKMPNYDLMPEAMPNYDLTPETGEFAENVTLYRGTTGSEGKNGCLFMTDDLGYAQKYIRNGGHIESITIPKITLDRMSYNHDMETLLGEQFGNYTNGHMEYKFFPDIKTQILNYMK